MTILGPGAFRQSALEHHVDALLVQLALTLDIAQPLGDETIGNPHHYLAAKLEALLCTHALYYHLPMRFEFVVRSGKEAGRTVAVSTGQTIALGRLKGCDVVVDDEAASRRHCTITAREDVCVVADLQSANGTFVNEKRIATVELQKGDKIRIGSTVIELIDADRTRVRRGVPAPASPTGPHRSASSNRAVRRWCSAPSIRTSSNSCRSVYKRKDEAHLLESAQKYLTTLHKVSDILSRAASVEALFDSIVPAILEVTGGDRAAILMRNKDTGDRRHGDGPHQGRQGVRRGEIVAHGRQRRAREGHFGVYR